MSTPGLRDSLYLVSKGVPYDIAMHMSPARRLAFVVSFGELDGGTWDWNDAEWKKPE